MKPLLLFGCLIPYIISFTAYGGVRINGVGFEYATIKAAVNAAVNGDRLHVSTGLYTENVSITNKQLYITGGYLLDYITITNNPVLSVIDGSAVADSTVRLVSNAVIELERLSVTGGNAGFLGMGGGVRVGDACILTTRFVWVFGNSAYYGGGIGVENNGRLYAGARTFITQNTSSGGGGGIGTFGNNAVVVLEGPQCICLGNYAVAGGAVLMYGGTYEQRHETTVMANMAATAGGGICLMNQAEGLIHGPNTTVGGPGFTFNSVTNGNGGGIYLLDAALTVSGASCRVSGNYSSQYGGGIYMTNGILRVLDEAQVGDPAAINAAIESGGGLYAGSSAVVAQNAQFGWGIALTNGGAIYVNDCVVELHGTVIGSTNPAVAGYAHNGGGMYADACTVQLTGTRIIGNHAHTAGGLALVSSSSCELIECEIAHNTATNYAAIVGVYSGFLTLENSAVISNHARYQGGAGYWFSPQPLNIRNSRVCYNTSIHSIGGLIAMNNSTINMRHSEFSHNTTEGMFGGMFCYNSSLELVDCNIQDNQSNLSGTTNGFCGGIIMMGGDLSLKSATRENLVTGNSGTFGGAMMLDGCNYTLEAMPPHALIIGGNKANLNGGGMLLTDGSSGTISGRVIFEGNQAFNGAGIYASNDCHISLLPIEGHVPWFNVNIAGNRGGAMQLIGPNTVCNARQVEFTGNEALGNTVETDGGGAVHLDTSDMNAVNCLFRDNTTAGNGGAVFATFYSRLTIDGDFSSADGSHLPPNRFIHNRAEGGNSYGGAVCQFSDGSCVIEDSLFLSNSSSYASGALYAGYATCRVVNTIMSRNSSPLLGDAVTIFNPTDCDILNCTIAYNDDIGVYGFPVGNLPELQSCIVWGHEGHQVLSNAIVQFSDIQFGFPGAFNITNDPLFANAGMLDYQLLEGSPCIDIGATLATVTNDCIGTTRPYGGGWDMGAYEFIPEPMAIWVLLPVLAMLRKLNHPC
jgi:predicted outer membrane repeat protein